MTKGFSDLRTTAKGSLIEAINEVAGRLPQVYIDELGAKGDGVTNDTLAFQKASDIINQAGGGTLILSNKVYIVGKQTLAGAGGKGYSYKPDDLLYIRNCTKPVVIEGRGAVLKADSNLKFGSFNPTTGAVHTPTMPFTDLNYRADAYVMLQIDNNNSVNIKDLDLDGNITGITLGGEWGDYGYQCRATGARLFSNKNLVMENVNSHHHALDGFSIWYSLVESDERKPHTLLNCTAEYNARQGLSWTGGIGLTAINCKFNHTGKVRFSSEPGAGVDIEAENTVCREGVFLNCEMINNTGSGVVSYSGDGGYTTFKKCTIWGNTGAAVSPYRPGLVFEDCKIYGRITNPYGSNDPLEATKFIRCRIEDKNHPVYGIQIGTYLIDINAHNVLFEGCTLVNNYQKLIITSGSDTVEIFRDCKFIFKYSQLADKGSQAIFYGSRFEDVTFSDAYTTPPATAYFIDIPGYSVQVVGNVLVDATYTKWFSWSTGGAGMSGNIGSQVNKAQKFLSIHKRLYNSTYHGQILIGAHNAVPTSGTWGKGDFVFNESSTIGGSIGWSCVTGGDANATPWVATTAYTVGNLVNANGKVYKCSVAGTSGATPPSHSTGTVVDGTVSWDYVNTLAVFSEAGKVQTVKSGTITYNGDGVATTKTIAHGLGTTPSYYAVNESSLDAGNAEVKFLTADATNITVTFKTAPITGTNNVKLNWKAEI